MVFNSVTFVYYFLPIVIGVFYLLRHHLRIQNIWLLISSLFFYGWCNTRILLFLIIFGLINYCFGRVLYISSATRHSAAKKLVLLPAVALNLLCLYFVKYLNFSISVVNTFLHTGFNTVSSIIVPLGISFLVFSMISYLLDIYWEKTKPLDDLVDFFLFLSFFPKVSQGPITRCDQLRYDLNNRSIGIPSFASGLRRFCFGFAKKVLIADTLGASVDLIFSNISEGISPAAAWGGMLCYTFQIYFDFSGYTDMAIGLGEMLGFHLPENFDAPYHSKSVSEFWRRWHITLGRWFREYVYIPLGGNRVGKLRTYINLGVVWLLTGIWHGAAYTYIAWGIGLGSIIIFEKMIGKSKLYVSIPNCVKWLCTFLTIMFSWVLFRSNDLQNAAGYFLAMFGVEGYTNSIYGVRYFIDNGTLLALFVAIVLTIPVPARWRKWMASSNTGITIQNIGVIILFAISLLFMVNSTYNAFIYFQF